MLEALDLACERGSRKLFSGLSFALGPGELLLVAGPNGAGKTSLLRILCGLTPPATGEVRWQGKSVRSLGEDFLSQLFYLGHHNGVKDDLTALENLLITSRLAGQALGEEAARAALAHMGLAGREDLPAKLLSQGQRRRVALARLLVTRAPLWILDEPVTALDARAVELIQGRLAAHLAAGGLVVLTTHQPIEVNGVTPRRLELCAP
ncbi:cytochrome c biogenesis heme-transporting ATPase CcmA [Thiobacter aerophilum]|uniref:Cytochrome c biogenesis heme-transporting ATPase CcmA n=1 Tax=Thiobacter aerophilum TaxID=3121275 RepID=A0ABV0EES0_9BURK